MSTTANKPFLATFIQGVNVSKQWITTKFPPKSVVAWPETESFRLMRAGKKHFIVKRQFGAVVMTYKCDYPEAQRRFAVFVTTRRLLDDHGFYFDKHRG